jgi:hypothetical protein
MKATKKDFEFTAALLAAAIGGTPPLNLVELASAKFKMDNPRFDVDRFKRACGLTWQQIDVESWANDQS